MDVGQFKELLWKLSGLGLDPEAARIVQYLLDQLEEEKPELEVPQEAAIKMLSQIVEKSLLPSSPEAVAAKLVAEANAFAQKRRTPGGPGLGGTLAKPEPVPAELAEWLDAEIAAVVEKARQPRGGRSW